MGKLPNITSIHLQMYWTLKKKKRFFHLCYFLICWYKQTKETEERKCPFSFFSTIRSHKIIGVVWSKKLSKMELVRKMNTLRIERIIHRIPFFFLKENVKKKRKKRKEISNIFWKIWFFSLTRESFPLWKYKHRSIAECYTQTESNSYEF